jgi:hypothetical protein
MIFPGISSESMPGPNLGPSTVGAIVPTRAMEQVTTQTNDLLPSLWQCIFILLDVDDVRMVCQVRTHWLQFVELSSARQGSSLRTPSVSSRFPSLISFRTGCPLVLTPSTQQVCREWCSIGESLTGRAIRYSARTAGVRPPPAPPVPRALYRPRTKTKHVSHA